MSDDRNKLKLGKGSYFVKTQLRQLEQEDDTWEADFFPIPSSDVGREYVWLGLVLSHAHENVLAHWTVKEPPSVNDLARLLAEAIRRPLTRFAHRPRILHLRNKPEWSELLPHLKQVGIQVIFQDSLPKWDKTFGDLQAQVEQIGRAREAPPTQQFPRVKAAVSKQPQFAGTSDQGKVRIYTLDVFLPKRAVSRSFLKKKSGISRLIEIRGDQTLEDLHNTIFDAFDRDDEHLYEFQLGQSPKDPHGPTYGSRELGEDQSGVASETTIDSLRLRVGRSFGYLFDFGDNWWHQVNVEAIEDKVPDGKFPKVTKRIGKSPQQYPDEEDHGDDDDE
ncbi:MAG: plasmid pRiA4b ORF-3 family protein [Planctomycetes bacterium]|nr:plasmid pRiA4b ORF-3 family protein [Planctomycetota bacterium]